MQNEKPKIYYGTPYRSPNASPRPSLTEEEKWRDLETIVDLGKLKSRSESEESSIESAEYPSESDLADEEYTSEDLSRASEVSSSYNESKHEDSNPVDDLLEEKINNRIECAQMLIDILANVPTDKDRQVQIMDELIKRLQTQIEEEKRTFVFPNGNAIHMGSSFRDIDISSSVSGTLYGVEEKSSPPQEEAADPVVIHNEASPLVSSVSIFAVSRAPIPSQQEQILASQQLDQPQAQVIANKASGCCAIS